MRMMDIETGIEYIPYQTMIDGTPTICINGDPEKIKQILVRDGIKGIYFSKQNKADRTEPYRWNRMMMYLADLQLTYSPVENHGDAKLYNFINGLIEELEKFTDDGK